MIETTVTGRPKKRRRSSRLIWLRVEQVVVGVCRAILIAGISFIILYPLLVKLASSVMDFRDLWDHTVKWIPRNFTFDNYRNAFIHMDYPQAFIRTLLLVTSVALLQLISCSLVGYALGRFRFPGRSIIFGLVIFTLIVPPQMILVTLYLNFRFFNFLGLFGDGINLIGSYWPFIMMAATASGLKNGLFIYIMCQFFKGMPKQLEEAAYVDGAGYFRTFFTVMLPNAVPALVTVFLFSFVWQWNDIFYTSILAPGTKLMAFAVQSAARQYDEAHIAMTGQFLTGQEYELIDNTASLLFIAPLLILYVLLQRYFTESVQRSGIVG